MDYYSLFKFLHVASVIIWLGGGFTLVVLGVAANRARSNEQLGRVIENVTFLSPRLFVPSSLAAFVFGAIAAYLAWNLHYVWIWLGLAGFAATFATGILVAAPRSAALAKVIAAEGYSDAMAASGRELLAVVKFDFVVLFVVVADMVFKPAVNDWPVLVAFVIVLLAGAAFFLAPILRGKELAPAKSAPTGT
jgi:uncharacterized membrane protein